MDYAFAELVVPSSRLASTVSAFSHIFEPDDFTSCDSYCPSLFRTLEKALEYNEDYTVYISLWTCKTYLIYDDSERDQYKPNDLGVILKPHLVPKDVDRGWVNLLIFKYDCIDK